MYDYTELIGMIDSQVKSRAAICGELGINPSTLSKSLKNGTELSHDTVVSLSKFFNLKKAAEIDRVFFTKRVENNQPKESA